jgi:hypothetical protein
MIPDEKRLCPATRWFDIARRSRAEYGRPPGPITTANDNIADFRSRALIPLVSRNEIQ